MPLFLFSSSIILSVTNVKDAYCFSFVLFPSLITFAIPPSTHRKWKAKDTKQINSKSNNSLYCIFSNKVSFIVDHGG